MEEKEIQGLLASIRRGDKAAEAMLYNTLVPELQEYVRKRLGARIAPRLDPEDVVHETMLDILTMIHRGDRPIQHVDRLAKIVAKHVMYRVAHSGSIDFKPLSPAGSGGSSRHAGPAAPGPGPRTQLIRKENARLVDEALATLKPEQALILRLRLEGGGQKRKFKEIGELVGISEEAAERAYLRAKEKVKDYVKRRRGAAGDTTSRS